MPYKAAYVRPMYNVRAYMLGNKLLHSYNLDLAPDTITLTPIDSYLIGNTFSRNSNSRSVCGYTFGYRIIMYMYSVSVRHSNKEYSKLVTRSLLRLNDLMLNIFVKAVNIFHILFLRIKAS